MDLWETKLKALITSGKASTASRYSRDLLLQRGGYDEELCRSIARIYNEAGKYSDAGLFWICTIEESAACSRAISMAILEYGENLVYCLPLDVPPEVLPDGVQRRIDECLHRALSAPLQEVWDERQGSGGWRDCIALVGCSLAVVLTLLVLMVALGRTHGG